MYREALVMTLKLLSNSHKYDSSNCTKSNGTNTKVLKNVGENKSDTKPDSIPTGRRKSRAILEHLMTRARFYKMIESKTNK